MAGIDWDRNMQNYDDYYLNADGDDEDECEECGGAGRVKYNAVVLDEQGCPQVIGMSRPCTKCQGGRDA